MSDLYTEGYCKRCNRKRSACQHIIDLGKHCTAKLTVEDLDKLCNAVTLAKEKTVFGSAEYTEQLLALRQFNRERLDAANIIIVRFGDSPDY